MSWGRTAEQQRWIDEADAAEEERARGKREPRAEERRKKTAGYIAALEDRVRALEETVTGFNSLASGAAEFADAATKRLAAIEGLLDALERKLFVSIERRFGEAMGRLDAISPDARSRSKDYKFANERDDGGPVDLPNPLTPLVRKVTMN